MFSRRFMQVAVLVFVTITLALSAQAVVFSNASLKGSYSFLLNRWTVQYNQDAVVGVMAFDGAGNVAASFTYIDGGVVQTGTDSGTYTVNSNGTGAINFTNFSGTGASPHFAITLNSTAAGLAHGLQLVQTNNTANYVQSGTALLQCTTAATYSVASLKGNFSWQGNLWTANVNQAQSGGIGTFSFDGKGHVKGVWTRMDGGVLHTGTFTGTYTVNSDGSGSITVTFSPGPVTQAAFVLNNKPPLGTAAKGLQFLQTNLEGNIVISATALKQ